MVAHHGVPAQTTWLTVSKHSAGQCGLKYVWWFKWEAFAMLRYDKDVDVTLHRTYSWGCSHTPCLCNTALRSTQIQDRGIALLQERSTNVQIGASFRASIVVCFHKDFTKSKCSRDPRMHSNLVLVHSPLTLQIIFLGPDTGVYPGLQLRTNSSPGLEYLWRPSSRIFTFSSGLEHTGTTNRLRNHGKAFSSSCQMSFLLFKCL